LTYKTILVINTMHIGDLLLITPALRTLRTNFPDAKITLLTDKSLADLVRENPCIDECLTIDKHGRDKSFGALVHFIRRLRSRKFDLVMNLHRNERCSAITAFCGAKKRIGYAQPGFGIFYTKKYPNLAMADTPKELATKHQVTVHLEMLQKALNLKTIDDRGLEMKIPDAAEQEAARIWQQMLDETAKATKTTERNAATDVDTSSTTTNSVVARPVIAFNIGASWATKRWIDTYFAQCADTLIKEGYAVAFFGGPTDVPIVDACLAQMKENGSPHCHVFTGKVSLAVLAGLFARCAVLLTTDSGPMHIGVSQNVPVVTMFGASPVPTFYPYDARAILYKTPEPCHPCGIHDCPKKGDDHMACMKHIPVATVLDGVHELLKTYGGKAARDLPRENADAKGSHACRIVAL